jgi:peptidoglycan/LPS O-acetylase OafA/YrhL
MSSTMLLKSLKRLNLITRYPALLLTLGLVGWFEAAFTIEWSFPYCSSQEDGPASAVFGMPLPYIRWAGVSSMEYELMPSILIVNILILFAIAFPFVSWAVRKVAPPDQCRRRSMLNFAGLALLLSISAWTILLVQSGVYKIPVTTIASGYETYGEFRPVRFTFKDLHYDCTPSNYWFKDGWRPKGEKQE